MSTDPLDQLQSMFPSIDGDVIAIVFSESDKDVSSTVEKLLQLVPSDDVKREHFASVQPNEQFPPLRSLSPAPYRSSSGPANFPGPTGLDSLNSPWQGQQRNRRLQGPTHIPPNSKQYQRQPQRSGGGMDAVGVGQQKLDGQQNEPYRGQQQNEPYRGQQQNEPYRGQQQNEPYRGQQQNEPYRGQQKNEPYRGQQQNEPYRGQQKNEPYRGQQQNQSILGKRSAPGNQKTTNTSRSVAGGGATVESGNQQLFYQMGGSAATPMTSIGSANSLYRRAGAPLLPQPLPQVRNTKVNYQTQFQSPALRSQPQYGGGVQQQGHHQPSQQKQWHPAMAPGSGGGVGLYGYPDVRSSDQYFSSSWMNPRQATNDFSEQYYTQGQQKWPNYSENELRYGNSDRTGNPVANYGGSYLSPAMTSLLGEPHEQMKSDWPVYASSASGSNGTIGDGRGNMGAISKLLQPLPMSSNSFSRRDPSQSEPSLSNMAGAQQHQAGGSHHAAVESDQHGRQEVASSNSEGGRSDGGGATEKRKVSVERDSKLKDSGPKKLIILRGLPGSGKTTLAKSLVGTNGTICCTDDFFIRNGEYLFDPSLLEENHTKNKDKARVAMEKGRSPVIIDNTNTNAWEMKPYVLLAVKNDYDVEILEPDTPWRFKTAELARRNSHGVSRQHLEKMLERYDHRVTLESIIVSQLHERKPTPRPPSSEPSKNGNGGRQTTNGGQKSGRTKVSPPTPRQQHQTGSEDADHTPLYQKHLASSVATQSQSGGGASPRSGGQKGQRSNGRSVSPRPSNQRGQRSKDSLSAKSNRTEHHHVTENASTVGDGKSADSRKKVTPQAQQQHGHTTGAGSSKSQTEPMSRKGKRASQQTQSKNTPLSAAASSKKRPVSPAKGQNNKKQSSTKGKQNEKRSANGVARKRNGESESSKKEKKGITEEEEDDEEDEFLWDSSEEAELLDAGDVGNGPIFMTDKPPVEATFRPLPQLGMPVMNGVADERQKEALGVEEPQRQAPMFEIWKDSDDEDIDDASEVRKQEEDENPLPITRLDIGQCEAHRLPRTPEVPNIKQEIDAGVFNSASGSDLVPAPSHPWERTQSARDLQDINSHFVALMRRVQSANPVKQLSVLTESEGSSLSRDKTSRDNLDVFSMGSVWGSESGVFSSKMLLFGSSITSVSEPVDSVVKSSPSVQSVDSCDSQREKQKRAQSSYYSMLDALTEEMTAAEVTNKDDPATDTTKVEAVVVDEVKVGQSLLDQAISSTQSSSTVQEAVEDELKCPLRNKLTAELVMELKPVEDGEREVDSHALETRVDVDVLQYPLEVDHGSVVLPPFNADLASFPGGCKPFREYFLIDLNVDKQTSSLDALTEKVFNDEQLCPEQNLSALKIAFQAVAEVSKRDSGEEMMSSQFAAVGDVGRPVPVVRQDTLNSEASSFEDPAIVSKISLDGGTDLKLSTLILESGVDSERKASLFSSSDQDDPLDVFPSAYDEGMTVNFQLSAVDQRTTEDKSHPSSREETQSDVENNCTPFQSLTPVNDLSLISAGSTIIDGHVSGFSLEQPCLPVSLEVENEEEEDEEKDRDEFTSLQVSNAAQLEEGHIEHLVDAPCDKDDLPHSSSCSDLRFLTECFPRLEEDYLFAIFNMCKRSVEDALSVLLYSHSNQNDTAFDHNFLDSQTGTDTADDCSSTVSSVSYSDQLLIQGSGGQQPDSSPKQEVTSSAADYQKATFTVGGYEGEECNEEDDVGDRTFTPYFNESECINDEEIARALQEQLDSEASPKDHGSSLADETSSVGNGSDIIETFEQRERTSSHGSSEAPPTCTVGENLELKLSASLARQLQEMFGSVTDKLPFEGEMREEDMVVLLSERAAHEIYRKWLDTLHAKRIGYRVQSEIIMTKDEALARQLQEEEESKVKEKRRRKKHQKFRHLTEPTSLASMAAENYRAHHNSSPPQFGQGGSSSGSPQSGGGLVDIMGEQMAQQLQENELAQVVKDKSAPNLSLKLQLKELYKQFPKVNQPLVNETLVRNKFDIKSTVAELKVIVSCPPPPTSKYSIDGNVIGGLPRSGSKSFAKNAKGGARGCVYGKGSPSKRKLFNDDVGKEQKKNNDDSGSKEVEEGDKHQPSYIELRAEAAIHAKLRAETFMKAAHARGKKQWEVAQYYAQQAHLHTEKMNEANKRAAKAILNHNFSSSDELDLHGLHVDEAIAALQEKLASCNAGSKLRVVTGQGIHSRGGGARIRPAVIDYLQKKRYKIVYEKNAGALSVKIK